MATLEHTKRSPACRARFGSICTTALLCTVCSFAAAGPATLQHIPRSINGAVFLMNAASADGRTFVGSQNWQVFRWSTWAGYEVFGKLSDFSTQATGVSSDGSIIAGYGTKDINLNTDLYDGFSWRKFTGIAKIDVNAAPPGLPVMPGTDIEALSDDGATIGGYLKDENDYTGLHTYPFRRSGGVNFFPSVPAGEWARGTGLSRDGNVLIGHSGVNTSLTRACRWLPNGTHESLGILPGHDRSRAAITNFDGSAVIGSSQLGSAGASRVFRWTLATGPVAFPENASVSCLSHDGSVAGGSRAGVAVLWMSVTTSVEIGPYLASLGADISGWSFSSVRAISANGTILFGSGSRDGVSCYWRADLNGPCPADFNGDLLVDDVDFVSFVSGYDTLLCSDPAMPTGCPADLNSDMAVDDADFVLFVDAYTELLCP